MDKLQLANMLLENSTNTNNLLKATGRALGDGLERGLLKRYIRNYEKVKKGIFRDDEYNSKNDQMLLQKLDSSLSLIEQVGFDFKGWLLFEIPISDVFAFVNREEKKAFDLVFEKSNTAPIPSYIDETGNSHDTRTIQEAIDNYFWS